MISFHLFQIRSFLNRLTIIIHRYFEENTFQYNSGRRRLYVCVLRAEPGRAQAWVEDLGPGSGREFRPVATSNICNVLNMNFLELFGQVNETTYSLLTNNTILASDTTLYCVTDSPSVREVIWNYVDLAGIRTNLTSTTNVTTGVSIIEAYTTQPGYYTCEVSQNGGINTTTYTAVMTDTDIYTGM